MENDKHIQILINAINSNNCPNIILYSVEGINKLSLLLQYIKNNKNIIENEIIINSIKMIKNNFYLIFDMETISIKNNDNFIKILKEYTLTNLYYDKNYKPRIIILNNYNNINHIIQNKLRVIIEKNRLTTIFIIITNKYQNIFP